jgi:hypothetical protein
MPIKNPYDAAVKTQGSDYDRIMQGYKDQANNPISYQSNPDITNALSLLKNFSTNGGFSDSDINNIRERAISPIRSIYANAKENLNRQRVLSGGYSPGFAGATAKMSRDLASSIGNTTTNANAGIAQMVQSGKLAALSPYANLASSEGGRQLDVSKFNSDKQLELLKSQQSLYGTTPGLVSTFGNMALSANNQNENSRQFDLNRQDRNRNNILSMAGRL